MTLPMDASVAYMSCFSLWIQFIQYHLMNFWTLDPWNFHLPILLSIIFFPSLSLHPQHAIHICKFYIYKFCKQTICICSCDIFYFKYIYLYGHFIFEVRVTTLGINKLAAPIYNHARTPHSLMGLIAQLLAR